MENFVNYVGPFNYEQFRTDYFQSVPNNLPEIRDNQEKVFNPDINNSPEQVFNPQDAVPTKSTNNKCL